ncbi:MAG: radical SAM protein [Polyangiaceae bacterium]|nr:radical SAM protein [Polyangiaceae bacterium]
MDFLLISPPVGNVGQAVSSLPALTAFLRARGWDAHQWDLSIDSFHHFHSRSYLARCRRIVGDHGADDRLMAAADRAVGEIDAAKASLRQQGAAGRRDTWRWAFDVLRDAGVLLTAASRGRHQHDFRHFDIPGAVRGFDSLGAALEDGEANPFIGFFMEHALPRLRRRAAVAIGISITYYSQLIPAFTLARLLRLQLPGTHLILGGGYLTATASDVERIPSALLPADAIVLHDGEDALDAWLNVVVRGRGALGDVPNVCLPQNGTFRRVSPRPHHTDLATVSVPMLTMQGLDLERYLVPKYAIGLPLSRGCHWGRCAYCNISNQTLARYRRRQTEQAVADMRATMAETGSNWFDLPVDSYHPRDLWELGRAILAADLSVEWAAEVLFDAGFTDPVVADLARSGCRCLRFGLESADPVTLKAMRKPTRPEVASRVLGSCRQHGIHTGVMVIAGFPTETQVGLGRTFDFLVDHRDRIDFVGIHPYSLVPGSPMARDPGAFGIYLRPHTAVMTTSLPFTNTNPVGMQNEDLPRVIEAMKAGLRDHYPELGELWTAAIGGWMTFPACCASGG